MVCFPDEPVVVGADWCNVALLDRGRRVLRVTFPRVPADRSQSWRELPLDAETPLTLAVRTDQMVSVDGSDEIARRFPGLSSISAKIGVDRIVALPLRDAQGTVMGSLAVASNRQRHPEPTRARLELVTEIAAQSLGRALLLESERATASRLDAVLRHVPVGVVAVDHDGHFVVRNDAYDVLARSPSPLVSIDEIDIERRRRLDGSSLTRDQLPLARALGGEHVQGARLTLGHGDGTSTELHIDSAPVRDAEGSIIGAVASVADGAQLDRLERERAVVRVLIRVASSLGDDAAALTLAAEGAVPALADAAIVYVIDGDALRPAAAASSLTDAVPVVDDLPTLPAEGNDAIATAARTRRVVHGDPDVVRALAPIVGALVMGAAAPSAFDEHRIELAQILADRVAHTVARAAADEERYAAMRRAEGLAERLARLQSVVDASLGDLDLDSLFDTLLGRLRDALASDTASVLLIDEETGMLHPWPSIGIDERPGPDIVVPVGEGFSGLIAGTGRPQRLVDPSDADLATGLLLRAGLRSLLGVPLTIDGRVVGVLHVGSRTRREWNDEDAEFLTAAASRIATSVDRTRPSSSTISTAPHTWSPTAGASPRPYPTTPPPTQPPAPTPVTSTSTSTPRSRSSPTASWFR